MSCLLEGITLQEGLSQRYRHLSRNGMDTKVMTWTFNISPEPLWKRDYQIHVHKITSSILVIVWSVSLSQSQGLGS